MSASGIASLARENVAELAAMVDAVDSAALDAVAERIGSAPRVFFSASGRSLLALKAVAMRLMHLGFDVHIAGEVTTPALASGDLLVVASARGGSAALTAVETARRAGGSIVAISTSSEAFDGTADVVLVLPARHTVQTVQHAGSLFEQSILVLGDAICRHLQVERSIPSSALDARHATL